MDNGQIYTLLPKAAAEIGVVGKGDENAHFRYKFRSIDDTISAVHPVFAKMGISLGSTVESVVREHQDKGDRRTVWTVITMRYTFYAPDGSNLSFTAVGEGADQGGDKSANKAMSAALKYCLGQALLLPYGGIDSESAKHDVSQPTQGGTRPPARPRPETRSTPPAQAERAPAPSGGGGPGPGKLAHDFQLKFPKQIAGKWITDPAVKLEDLEWVAGKCDPNDPNWGEKNREDRAKLATEIARRKAGGQPPASDKAREMQAALKAPAPDDPKPEDFGLPAEEDYPF